MPPNPRLLKTSWTYHTKKVIPKFVELEHITSAPKFLIVEKIMGVPFKKAVSKLVEVF